MGYRSKHRDLVKSRIRNETSDRRRRAKRKKRHKPLLSSSFERLEPRHLLATVGIAGVDQIAFLAAAGETNTVTVSLTAGVLTIQDSSATISASPEYTVVSPNEVTINTTGFTSISVNTLDQNDSVDASGVGLGSSLNRMIIQGGTGTNNLTGSQLDDFFLQAVGASNTNDGQGQLRADQWTVITDELVFLNDTTMTIGGVSSNYANIEAVNLSGGPSDNIFDLSAMTPASGITGVNFNGGIGDDMLIGGMGREIFRDTIGTNTFIGGGGVNDVIAIASDADMTITDTTLAVGTSFSTHTGIARVDLIGGASDNVIDASGVTTGGTIISLRMLGQDGNDTLIGSELDDQIRDTGGANTIDGRGGRDVLVIDSDADLTLTNTIIAIGSDVGTHTNIEDVRLNGGSGDSVFDASAVDGATGVEIVFLIGNAGDDVLIGSHLADVFIENLGNNTIVGGGQLPGTRDRVEFRVDSSMTATDSTLTVGSDLTTFSGIEDLRMIAGVSGVELDGAAVTTGTGIEFLYFQSSGGDDLFRPSSDLGLLQGLVSGFGYDTLDLSHFLTDPVIVPNGSGSLDGERGTVDGHISYDNFEEILLPQFNEAPEITSFTSSATFANKGTTNESVSVLATFTDVNSADVHTAVIDWGDGTTSVGNVNQSTGEISADHDYLTGGLFDVTITVNDGTESVDALTTAVVTGMRLTDGGELQVIGTDGKDKIHIKSKHDRVEVKFKGKQFKQTMSFDPANVTSIYVATCEGDDHVHLDKQLTIDSVIELGAGKDHGIGGGGNDLIRGGSGDDHLQGNDGNDILLGQEGKDHISGGGGDDILIGGTGRDHVHGGSGQNILIGESTIHDENDAALLAIQAEWVADKPIEVRIQNLIDGTGDASGANGVNFLNATTILDDGERDKLFGDEDEDWFATF